MEKLWESCGKVVEKLQKNPKKIQKIFLKNFKKVVKFRTRTQGVRVRSSGLPALVRAISYVFFRYLRGIIYHKGLFLCILGQLFARFFLIFKKNTGILEKIRKKFAKNSQKQVKLLKISYISY